MMIEYREDDAWWKDKRQWTQAGTREILTRYKFKRKKIPMRVIKRWSTLRGEAMESPSLEIQNAPGHGPEQLPPAEHALRRRLDRRPPGVPSSLGGSIIIHSDDQQNISK